MGTTAKPRMPIVIAGHVDHGKSSIIGRLLADTGSLPEGKLAEVEALCARTARPFEYAFLLDALKEERAQGITIDAARVFFSTVQRAYQVIDAPGHVEFVRNMVTGAARAEAALLVIDAQEGIRENSRRHGHLISLLGIRQLAVLINKMDLVGYDESAFDGVRLAYTEFLAGLAVDVAQVIPVSARFGDNLVQRSAAMPWYRGPTVVELLDGFDGAPPRIHAPLRFPVQDVYKFTARGDDRRIVAGTLDSGSIAVGDELVFHPSGQRSRVRSIEAFNASAPEQAAAGSAAGITLVDPIFVTRGDLATRISDPAPRLARRLRASLFWLGPSPLAAGTRLTLKLGTAATSASVERIERVLDATELAVQPRSDRIERNEVADVILQLDRAIACDEAGDLVDTGRFVLVGDYQIRGGGLIREVLSGASPASPDRADRGGAAAPDRSAGILAVQAGDGESTERIGRALERRLIDEGVMAHWWEPPRDERTLTVALHALASAGVVVIADAARLPGRWLESGIATARDGRYPCRIVEASDAELGASLLTGELVRS